MRKTLHGPEFQPENRQILIKLFQRTLIMSLMITVACILLGYPVAWLLANLPRSQSNLLMILVLLPFWTSLLVRTSAWKVMLQQQGVINDLFVALGIIEESGRLVMINNQFGTIIAMTHIFVAVYDPAHVFSDANDTTNLPTSSKISWCNELDSILESLLSTISAWNWSWIYLSFHTIDWLLYYSRNCWW